MCVVCNAHADHVKHSRFASKTSRMWGRVLDPACGGDERPQDKRPAWVAGASEAGLPVRLSRLLVEDGPAKRRALSGTTGGATITPGPEGPQPRALYKKRPGLKTRPRY